MSERKLFWLGFIGGIIRIFGILMLLLTAYAGIGLFGLFGLADWRGVLPFLIILALASGTYYLGKKLEIISENGRSKTSRVNPRSDATK